MSLIQALYNPQVAIPTEEQTYREALSHSELSGVLPQMYWLLHQKGHLKHTPSFFQEHLQQKFTETLYLNIFIKHQLEQLLEQFEHCGIDVIPLKGTQFAEQYFGHLGARPTSDIDVLIRPSDLKTATEEIRKLGYITEQKHIPGHFHYSFSKNLPNSPIPLTIELHWDVLKRNTANFHIDEFWNQALPVKKSTATPIEYYEHIKQLSDNHTFYLICLHGWRHNLSSLKYFLDIIQMIDRLHDQLDYHTLFRDAAAHQTSRRIIRTLSIVYKQFPHLAYVKKLPSERPSRWREYKSLSPEHGEVKGINLKNYIDFLDYQFLSYDSVKHSLIEAMDGLSAHIKKAFNR